MKKIVKVSDLRNKKIGKITKKKPSVNYRKINNRKGR